MVGRALGHIRRQPVAFIALFLALGGAAMAAGNFIKSSDRITVGSLAGSTYGDPVIAAKAVRNNQLVNSSLKVNPGTGLTGGGAAALGGGTLPLGVADGGIGTSQLADGAVTGSKVASDTLTGANIDASTLGKVPSATNADTLGGHSPSDFLSSSAIQADDETVSTSNIIGSEYDFGNMPVIPVCHSGPTPGVDVFDNDNSRSLDVWTPTSHTTVAPGDNFITLGISNQSLQITTELGSQIIILNVAEATSGQNCHFVLQAVGG